MPLYEYQCDACGQRFEVIRKFSDPPLDVCTLCGNGPVNRLQSSPAIQFKGSGWYITDYARNKKGEGGKGDSGASDKTSAEQKQTDTSDASSSETAKTATKNDTAAKSESSPPAKADGTAKKD